MGVNGAEVFLPFKLACETRSANMQVIALNCIQKLVLYGYLTNTSFPSSKIRLRDGAYAG